MRKIPEIVCPAGTLSSLKAAVEAGADAVYCGFRDETNARNFAGLNFTREDLKKGVKLSHDNGAKVLVAINTYPQAGNFEPWKKAVDDAKKIGVDAVIVADIGLCQYVKENHPDLRLHLSVQASASSLEAIKFYAKEFGVKRVVLPRVLSLEEIAKINELAPVETEIFGFGGLCVMAEGRCCLSSYITGVSPNKQGACSPASHIKYKHEENGDLTTILGDYTINRFKPDEAAGYPTTCKGKYVADGKDFVFEKAASLNVLPQLEDVINTGVSALKIEGRQRGRAYVSKVVTAFRTALDAYKNNQEININELNSIMEGLAYTSGAYEKSWQ
jgi:putative protease